MAKMAKNVFIFGAGADKQHNKKFPLGNELIIDIFSNLDKVKDIIYNKRTHKYSIMYSNLQNEVEIKTKNFFSWKTFLKGILKRGIKNTNSIFDEKVKSTKEIKMNGEEIPVPLEIINVFKKGNDPSDQRFAFALLVNIFGWKIHSDVSKKLKSKIIDSLKDEVKINFDKITHDIGNPLSFEPETVLVKESEKIIEDEIKEERRKKPFDKMNEKERIKRNLFDLAMIFFDYTYIYDNIYQAMINYKMEEYKSKALKYLHFLLTMRYTLSKLSNDDVDDSKSYYRVIRELKNKRKMENYYINLNYTKYAGSYFEKVNNLHGNIDELLNLESKNIENFKDMNKGTENIYMPNFVSQSLLKPIVSVEMIERYYKAYEVIKNAKRCFIIGFGFNRDDNHIINILQKANQENKNLEIIVFAGKDASKKIKENQRLFHDSKKIKYYDYKQEELKNIIIKHTTGD